ncbi:MAG: UDP-N-acetylglucosamine 2-epimerase, partial [Dehalococcoidia bacterium]
MKQRKICVVITNRGNYARLKSVLRAIEGQSELELQLVVGAAVLLERYGTAANIIARDGFEPAARIYLVFEGENPVTMAKTAGMAVVELATAFDNLKPDVVIAVGDRFESISSVIAASYLNIPVVHIQGGEVTGSIDEKV